MIRASVIGATGYAGEELTRLLFMHPDVEVVSLASKSFDGQSFADVYPNFLDRTDIVLQEPDLETISSNSDVVFLALPHGLASKNVTEKILEDTVIIDLGADFRLWDIDTYQDWYKTKHYGKDVLDKAVYGLPEYYREQIKKTNLIANPGCYPTASLMALLPLVKNKLIDPDSIIIDAASGVTGAGRTSNPDYIYCSVDENYRAYGVGGHRHLPEIEQIVSDFSKSKNHFIFTPHLLPMQRGILATIYADIDKDLTEERVEKAYKSCYDKEPFVRYLGKRLPETKYVKGSNYVDIGYHLEKRTNRLIVVSAIDNLMKGAASQAIQNMNIRFKIKETTGIDMIPDLPI